MKPAPFEYDAPGSLAEAIGLLREHGDEAKLIAGGQSLVPLLALRFAQPARLVDLNRVPGLAGVRALDDGGVAIGAMTRTRELEESPLVAARAPLAASAAPLIGHRQIRSRGTVGGSIAHADAAAELPAVALALRATLVADGPDGVRTISADEFFHGYYTTALAPDEVLTEIRLPALATGTGTAFLEVSRRHGDFAMVGVAAVVTLSDAVCSHAAITLIGVADQPLAAAGAAATLVGSALDAGAARAAGEQAAADVSPPSDLHASAAYRKALTRVLVQRAVLQAAGGARDALAPA